MTIQQPTATSALNTPDHSLSHRVFANDDSSPVKAVVVNSAGTIFLGDGGTTNYAQFSSSGLLGFAGTAGIDLPYGSFSDSTTQSVATTTVAYPVTFNTDEAKHGVTHSTATNTSRIQIDIAGTYLIAFSAIGKSAAVNESLDIWLAVNGTPVPRSNTISRFVGTANERIITVTYLYTFTAGQYFQLYWRSSHNGTTLPATAAQANPTRPACPSIILTVNMISKA